MVRDNVYESTIKPIIPVRRVPIQVQPHINIDQNITSTRMSLTRMPTEPIICADIDAKEPGITLSKPLQLRQDIVCGSRLRRVYFQSSCKRYID
jgi:hypothetical protein